MNPNFIYLKTLCIFAVLLNVVSKHNILLIISDDLRTTLGCYGDKIAYTPNLDALSKESVTFLSTYAQQALCAPSRNSFLTSRRPDTLRLYDFYSYWRDVSGNFTTLPQYFKEHGYYTKSVGKVFHPGKSSNFTDDQPYSWSCDPYHPPTERFKDAPVCGQDVTKKSNLVCPVVTSFQPGGTLPDLESLREAKAFLRKRKETKKIPFFLAVGFHKPHIPLKYPKKYLGYYPIENMTIPPNKWEPLDLPHVAWNHWQDIRRRDDIGSLNISFPFGRIPDEWSQLVRQSYYAAVSYIDNLIGKLLKELKKSEMYNNTIIVVMSDHGWSLGEHGEWSKFSNYEVAVKVPLIIRIPRLTNIATPVLRSTRAPVELLDLFPTLVDATVLPPMPLCPRVSTETQLCTQGVSLMPLIHSILTKNKTVEGLYKKALSQYPRPGVYPSLHPNSDKPLLHEIQYMGYSLRTLQYRYTEWPKWQPWGPNWSQLAGTELYDHSIDPMEEINLANQPQFKNIRKKLSILLRKTVVIS